MPGIVTLSEADALAECQPGRTLRMATLAAGPCQELVWNRITGDDRYRMHSHPWEQTSVMIAGAMRLTVGDETRDIGPGDMWHVPPDVIHGGEILGDEPVVFVDVYARSGGVRDGFITYY